MTERPLDIIESCVVFDDVVVGVLNNPEKKGLFSIDERIEMLEDLWRTCRMSLSVHLPASSSSCSRVRGSYDHPGTSALYRTFEFEFRMASMNRKLAPDIETFFMMTSNEYAYLSSSVVKQVASFGGCVRGLVPVVVEKRLRDKFRSGKAMGQYAGLQIEE